MDNERWIENQIQKDISIMWLKPISNFWAKKLATLVQFRPIEGPSPFIIQARLDRLFIKRFLSKWRYGQMD